MHVKTCSGLVAAMLLAFAPPILVTGCNETEKDYVEYRAEDISYYRGDSCVERYLLYEDDGTYERHIGGTYCGMELPGRVFGTLYETGTYKANPNVIGGILFTSNKQYDTEKKELINLGIDSETRKGQIIGKTLTINYRIWVADEDDWFNDGYYKTLKQEYTRK